MTSLQVSVGIDLGSTTTKAIILAASGQVMGRGITNSRSNYDVACRVAREEAFVRARFALTRVALSRNPSVAGVAKQFLPALERNFRLQQHLSSLERLREALHRVAEAPRHDAYRTELEQRLDKIYDAMVERASALYGELAVRKSDFSATWPPPSTCAWRTTTATPKGLPSRFSAGFSTLPS